MPRKVSFKPGLYIFLIVVALISSPAQTYAWGSKGHQIVARITTGKLSASARQAIADLLAPGETLESISTWADDRKAQDSQSRSWHFIDIPLNSSSYSASRDCKDGNCLIEAINKQLAILKDTSRKPEERSEALKYLVHFIADLHQPFHVSTNTNPPDAAANRVRVISLSGRSSSLHEIWDNDLIDYGLKRSGRSFGDYHAYLGQGSKNNSLSPIITRGSVIDWALETHRLAWGAYNAPNGEFMVADKRSWNLDQNYYDKNVSVVEDQLRRAGLRLAKILNDVFNVRLAK